MLLVYSAVVPLVEVPEPRVPVTKALPGFCIPVSNLEIDSSVVGSADSSRIIDLEARRLSVSSSGPENPAGILADVETRERSIDLARVWIERSVRLIRPAEVMSGRSLNSNHRSAVTGNVAEAECTVSNVFAFAESQLPFNTASDRVAGKDLREWRSAVDAAMNIRQNDAGRG